ncbi:hypothetical protein [Amphibacillus cookii]|uniref:hypothetical protein n=1 Tax=Amphibacillus cookii TaxID=767787 RepID=UPI00195956EA|nr:hypothetical protein [Amphibacillus cookii]MBM7542399.1 hypothetical protein [Amphibacillus cookii]
MKHTLRTFALGLLTATLVIGYQYYLEDDEPEVIEVDMSEQEMIDALETAGYYIADSEPIVQEDIAPEDDQVEEDNETDEDTNANDESNHFILTIESGMTISQVADYLIVANLIDSRSEFTDYLSEHGYGNNIQVGQFELSRDMTLEEVVETIASQRN